MGRAGRLLAIETYGNVLWPFEMFFLDRESLEPTPRSGPACAASTVPV